MEIINVPCNTLADEENYYQQSSSSPESDKNNSSSRSRRRTRESISDLEILNHCMSPERKKTLMCTEQSNFKVLHNFKTPKCPKKKFSALAPTEYAKFSMQVNNIKICASNNNNLKYNYPIDLGDELRKKPCEKKSGAQEKNNNAKTHSCLVF